MYNIDLMLVYMYTSVLICDIKLLRRCDNRDYSEGLAGNYIIVNPKLSAGLHEIQK